MKKTNAIQTFGRNLLEDARHFLEQMEQMRRQRHTPVDITKYEPEGKAIYRRGRRVEVNRWLGPRGSKGVSGTYKRLARVSWDQYRSR